MTAKTEVITLRLDKEMMDAVKAIAKRDESPISIVLRRALRKGLTSSGAMQKTDGEQLPDWD
jgi:predicted transcriptional regulator